MRTLRIFGIGAAILALPLLGLIAYASWERAHMIYPSPENESAFLRAYDSKAVAQPFMVPEGVGDSLRERGGGAGTKFVTHSAGFVEHFTMRADQKLSLMTAVNWDLSQRLHQTGVHVLSRSGTSSTGFHFEYETGNTIGEVSIQPIGPGATQRNMPLPVGLEDVALNIQIREEWFPRGIPPGVVQLLPEGSR